MKNLNICDIRNILRLMENSPDISSRELEKKLGIPKSTCHRLFLKIKSANIPISSLLEQSDDFLERLTITGNYIRKDFVEPDWQFIWNYLNPVREYKSKQKPTLAEAWIIHYVKLRKPDFDPEHSSTPPECMSRRTFVRRYAQYCLKNRKPGPSSSASVTCPRGSICEIDTIGDKFFYEDSRGTRHQVRIFTATLRYSGLLYCEAMLKADGLSWQKCIVNAFYYFRGTTKYMLCDNDSALTIHGRGKNKRSRPRPGLLALCSELGIELSLAPIFRPRFKARDESNNRLVVQKFFSQNKQQELPKAENLDEYNKLLLEELDRFNSGSRNHGAASRRDIFELYEREALSPLPAVRPIPHAIEFTPISKQGWNKFGINYYFLPQNYWGSTVLLENLQNTHLSYRDPETSQEIVRYEISENLVPPGLKIKDKKFMPPREAAVHRGRDFFERKVKEAAKKYGVTDITPILKVIARFWGEHTKDEPIATRHCNHLLKLMGNGGNALKFTLTIKACAFALSKGEKFSIMDVENAMNVLSVCEELGLDQANAKTSATSSQIQHQILNNAAAGDDGASNIRGAKYYEDLLS